MSELGSSFPWEDRNARKLRKLRAAGEPDKPWSRPVEFAPQLLKMRADRKQRMGHAGVRLVVPVYNGFPQKSHEILPSPFVCLELIINRSDSTFIA